MIYLDSHCYDQQLYFYNALQNLNRFKLIVYILYESLGPNLKSENLFLFEILIGDITLIGF